MRLRSTLHLAAFELHLHDVWMLLNVAVHTTASEDFEIKSLPAIANAGHVPQVSISHMSKLRHGRGHQPLLL